MKIIVALLLTSLMACGGKAKKNATPNTDKGTETTEPTGEGTGGSTYGGATKTTTPPTGG
jgi:hypothetical protein